ncbi:MAG: hypothetical protein GYB25_07525 [Rhodobacteraceae bacterium]|nr:hypothetical protein [Paracoccaceae bacterium]
MSSDNLTYPGGLEALLGRYNSRRDPFDFTDLSFPPEDVDLALLAATKVTEEATKKPKWEPNPRSAWANKRRTIAREFIGNSELAYLNALLISNLRKSSAPEGCAALFLRLWEEQPAHLIEALDIRWKVSSIMTFADHGGTDVQRQVGQALRMLFGMMKLYEFERLYSGFDPQTPFGFSRKKRVSLPLNMDQYSLRAGGLDSNLLAPVWELAMTDPGIAPLANHLMEELNRDPGTVFRRLRRMREVYARLKGDD